MKKIKFCFILFFSMLSFAQNSNSIYQKLLEKSEDKTFKMINDLLIKDNSYDKSEINKEVANSFIYNLNKKLIQELFNESPELINCTITIGDNQTVSLQLYKEIDAFSNLIITEANGKRFDFNTYKGLFYRGIVQGEINSLVSLSIFENEIAGFIASKEGNVVIGKLSKENKIIIYNDKDMISKPTFNCETLEEDLTDSEINNYKNVLQQSLTSNCVRLYFETEFDIYQNLGSNINNVVNYVTNLYNQVGTLYANDGISTLLSDIKIWTQNDPYTATSSSALLTQFQSQTTSINGDLGQLLTFRPIGGGIAAGFNGICNPNVDLSLSVSGNLNSTIINVPTYSWNVMVVTHEFGHLFGSRHTHACVWNGNNTAIDGCAGYTEGNCSIPGIPSNGGTIMSYCHTQSVGINFANGFGPQPRNVITNNVNNGACLSSCLPCPSTLIVTNNVTTGSDTRQASSTINASNTINSGAVAIYHAGDEVLLSNGFTATNGSVFRAYIEGCTDIYVARQANPSTPEEYDYEVQNVENETLKERLKIAPNPNNGVFKLLLEKNTDGEIEIVDLYGVTIYKSSFTNQKEIAIAIQNSPKGIYILKVKTNSGVATIEKIVKE